MKPRATTPTTPPMAWRMLALGVAAQAGGSFLVSTPAYLIPFWHAHGMSLAHAGTLAAAPTLGMVATLVAWGAATDRLGERRVIAAGLALTAVFALAAAPVHGTVALGALLALGGAAAASTNASSGRIVVGWFPRQRRGLAMGIRQMSQPLGVAVAALVVPPLAERHGVGAALLVAGTTAALLAVACAVGVVNPSRLAGPAGAAAATANPYRADGFLVRVHAVSVLLVVPQFTLSTFGMAWLTVGLGWGATDAGATMAASQLVGAVGRIGVGMLSDRVGSRMRPLRWVALAGVATMLASAAAGEAHWLAASVVLLVVATSVSVADNGLAFTAVAEAAGPGWSGRALGVQNSGQFLAASAVGPAVGALITLVGYPVAFALVALTPLVAAPLVPARDQHRGA
ncbi:MFS transporter [Xylanimonas sp. McL0601]|uniref:MFS transporter n=1 Tax=Xylanimonas sp. McL0601 TaxID=3414739 RepID=UPI003CFB6DF0